MASLGRKLENVCGQIQVNMIKIMVNITHLITWTNALMTYIFNVSEYYSFPPCARMSFLSHAKLLIKL